jgi:hypothetical protein
MLTTLDAGATTAYFKMKYAPFGLGDGAWTAATGNAAPVWTIRNGLNDVAQDADTDFAHYGLVGTANANGAISVAVVDAAVRGAGLFEDGNPWPIAGVGMTGASANDLAAALTYLNTNGTAAKYGAYTIRLGVDPSLPTYPDTIILGDGNSGADWQYPTITNTALIIDGTAPVAMPGRELLWALNNGDSVRYGSGITPPIVITLSAETLTPYAFNAATTTYGIVAPVSVDAVTFTAQAADASAAVSYALDAPGAAFSADAPEVTLGGQKGSVTFSVKVTTAATERVWGPYTFDVSPLWTVSGGLSFTPFEYGAYAGIKFTGGTGTLTFALPVTADLLVVGGGGGGEGRHSGNDVYSQTGGGGGGYTASAAYAMTKNDYAVIVGAGGAGGETDQSGGDGGLSSLTPAGELAVSAAGGIGSGSQNLTGSVGTYNNITGANIAYGGDGGKADSGGGVWGPANTGKGGGGGWEWRNLDGGPGGSGVVVIRWAK